VVKKTKDIYILIISELLFWGFGIINLYYKAVGEISSNLSFSSIALAEKNIKKM